MYTMLEHNFSNLVGFPERYKLLKRRDSGKQKCMRDISQYETMPTTVEGKCLIVILSFKIVLMFALIKPVFGVEYKYCHLHFRC